MKGKIIMTIFFVCSHLACFAQDTTAILREYTEDGFKNYAFCKCIKYARFGNLPIKDPLLSKDGSLAGYWETCYPISYYSDAIDSLAYKYSQRFYPSLPEKPLIIMKCLDFYNSKELNDSIVKFTDESKIYWDSSWNREDSYRRAKNWKQRIEGSHNP
ncbi:MAG: hypothetical protein U0L74_11750 [Paludibacteraceae bacterium]|nr:hypothetical protein [Paludibacteraceae bacterium]